MAEEKKKLNLRRTVRNNVFMLKLIAKATPSLIVTRLVQAVIGAVDNFLIDTYLFMYALNALQAGTPIREIIITLVLMLSFSIVSLAAGYVSWYIGRTRQPKLKAYITDMLQKKAARVDLACFENPEFFDTYVKASGESSERAIAVLDNICDVLWSVINIVMTVSVIVVIAPEFLILASLPLIVTLIIGKKRNKRKYDNNMETKEAARRRDYVRRTFYLKDFSKEMRLTQMHTVMYDRMRSSVAEMKGIVKKHGPWLMFYAYLFEFVFGVIVNGGSMVLAVYKTLVTKTMLIGDCYVIINSILNIAWSLSYSGDVILKLDENSLYIDNLRAFLDYEVKIDEVADAPEAPELETLELRGVGFSYTDEGKKQLSDIDISISKGQRIAIVGHNGAGKTTLVKLLLRLYDPTEGGIFLNGKDIRDYKLSSYRGKFDTVFQDYRLFAVSVAENVMLGKVTKDEHEAVRDALAKSSILEKIDSFENKENTIVTKEFDKNGAVFSGGEAQKISIARIFAAGHEVVIMDEPTSALDPIAEQEMYKNMFEACEGKTVIFISHRLSSAAMADRIYMFEKGRIVEEGTHSELLTRDGKYADMWHKQADTYLESEVTV